MSPLAEWSYGYCAARGFERPSPALNGRSLWFPVGKPDQAGRYILVDQGVELLGQIPDPNIYVEIAGSREAVAPLVPAGWQLRAPAFLMVRGTERSVGTSRPPGIGIERFDEGRCVVVRARTPDGTLAARGVVGLERPVAVFDQIVTEPAFRRRGLGSVLMQELSAAAERKGATRFLLIATEDGRALYRRLGWTVISDVVSIISPSG